MILLSILGGVPEVMAVISYPESVEVFLVITTMLWWFTSSGMALQNWASSMVDD